MTILLTLILLLFAASAEAATYWMDINNGNDGNACTNSPLSSPLSTTAKRTLGGVGTWPSPGTGGLSCLNPGDTLYIRGGTYSGINFNTTVKNGTSDTNRVTISAYPGETVRINGTFGPAPYDGAIWPYGTSYLTIRGNPGALMIVDGTGTTGGTSGLGPCCADEIGTGGVTPAQWSHGVIYEYLEVRFFRSTAGYQGGGSSGFTLHGMDTIVRNSDIHDNGAYTPADIAVDSFGGYGIYDSGIGTLIENNLIHHNSGYGIQTFSGDCKDPKDPSGNTPMACTNRNGNIIRNNDIYANNQAGCCGGIVAGSGSYKRIYNNVIRDHIATSAGYGDGIEFLSGCLYCSIYNNTIYGNSGVPFPMYSSACFDKGVPVTCPHPSTIIKNNISYKNGNAISGLGAFAVVPGATFSNNLCDTQGPMPPDGSQGAYCDLSPKLNTPAGTNLPLFVDEAAKNFNLSVSPPSPAINKGVANICSNCGLGGTAVNISYTGSFPDLGAFETGVIETVAITLPPNNTTTAASIQAFNGTVNPSGTAVTWSNNRGGTGSATVAGTTWSTSIPLFSGTNIITVTAGSATAINTITYFSPTATLVAALGFDEGTGTTATDTSGNNNNGAFSASGISWLTSGKFGKALTFNGTSGQVTIPGSSSLNNLATFTVELWARPTVAHNDFRGLATKYDAVYLYGANDTLPSCAAGSTLGGAGINISPPTTFEVCHATPLPITPTWTHIAITYDGSILKMYKDGALVTQTTAGGAVLSSINVLTIGGSIYGEFWEGDIDEVRIYDGAIPQGKPGDACIAAPTIFRDMGCPITPLAPPTAASGVTVSSTGGMTIGSGGGMTLGN